MNNTLIPFNRPYLTGKEIDYIQQTCASGKISGNGNFTSKCQDYLKNSLGSQKVLLTQSCTAALEMAAILIDIQPGDEIICPSYTFVSTVNAFVLRGAVPVFIDIRPDTLNIDETKIEAAITSKTKAIVVVHYAGVGCEMETVLKISSQYNLFLIEDAAQGITATYKNKPLGSFGHLATFSFHETKNIISGEGGALIINDASLVDRAEIIWEKGTNRSRYFRGQVDKYTWVDIGSSYLPSEITAAFLWAQLERSQDINLKRKKIWDQYKNELYFLTKDYLIELPTIPNYCEHNAHMFYLLFPNLNFRTSFIDALNKKNILCVFHYIPLHSSQAGIKYGRAYEDLIVTNRVSDSIVRLPLWIGLEKYLDYIISEVKSSLHELTQQLVF